MPPELLADVAEALNQLEEDRDQLNKTRQLEHAVKHFEQRYRLYAGTLTRRQARELRQAQTSFDNASESRNKAQSALHEAEEAFAAATMSHEVAKRILLGARARLETLQSDPANQDANRLSQAQKDAKERRSEAELAQKQCDTARLHLVREEERSRQANQRLHTAKNELESARTQCVSVAEFAGTATCSSATCSYSFPSINSRNFRPRSSRPLQLDCGKLGTSGARASGIWNDAMQALPSSNRISR